MNSRALTEVYDIIGFMDDEYQNRIPIKLKEFIKSNKDSLYDTGITSVTVKSSLAETLADWAPYGTTLN